jgi:pimeloyl-ACP methyl ester carboxylesterase
MNEKSRQHGDGSDKSAPLPWAKRVEQGVRRMSRALPKFAQSNMSVMAPCVGARSALITFGGNAGGLLIPAAIRELPQTHVIAVTDRSRCFGMCGLDQFGDTYEACLDSFRALLAELGVTVVHFVGVSAGGYAALRFGLDLGGSGVLGLGIPTTLNLADDPGKTLKDYPALTAIYRKRRGMAVDLARLYSKTLPRPRVLLVYSPKHQRDAWQAKRMREVRGVELDEVQGEAGHRLLRWLDDTGGLSPYLERLRSMRPLTAVPSAPSP